MDEGSEFTSVGELGEPLLQLVNWRRTLGMMMTREAKDAAELPFDKLTAVSDYASRLPEQATRTPPPEPIEDELAASDP